MKQFNTVINRREGCHHYTVIIAITAEPRNLLLHIAETRSKKFNTGPSSLHARFPDDGAHARKLL